MEYLKGYNDMHISSSVQKESLTIILLSEGNFSITDHSLELNFLVDLIKLVYPWLRMDFKICWIWIPTVVMFSKGECLPYVYRY
jgi:hypothetical protein